jgi:hypothetical protein
MGSTHRLAVRLGTVLGNCGCVAVSSFLGEHMAIEAVKSRAVLSDSSLELIWIVGGISSPFLAESIE